MLVLPLPMVIALVLGASCVYRWARGDTHTSLLALIGICAMQAALIALVQYYGVVTLRPIQPVLAMFIPPVAWVAFQRAAGGVANFKNMLHLLGPLAALTCLLVEPILLDLLIPVSFSLYGLAMLQRLSGGEASLPHSLLHSATGSIMAWRVVAVALIGSAVSDWLIAWDIAQSSENGGVLGVITWLPSLGSSLSLLALGALSLTSAIESRRDPSIDCPQISPDESERDALLLARLDAHLSNRKPYLDPDLTLARLARQLGVPAKQLSTAINRSRKENVSRTINRLRIEEACVRLRAGSSVTEAMLASGFNTKSNFNREFMRIKKMSPTQWVMSAAIRPIP
jgi:AraC-like DNA-binding protein